MTRGRQSKTLRPEEIRRLEEFRVSRRLTYPQLKLAMEAPFKWSTLKKALRGLPIWDLNHKFIVEWLDVHCPEKPAAVDGKTAAAGELVQRD
jgi:hypothetical protein